jgi:RimJ/RimL family protein N-acetyltransferase
MAQSSIFLFPIREISNDRLKLIPFNPDNHTNTFFRLSSSQPELYTHMPMGPWDSEEALKAEFHSQSQTQLLSFSNPTSFAFAIIDKTRPPSSDDPEGELAGTISLVRTSDTHLCTEIGFIIILPPYQRTHVAKNAVGLALQYSLEASENGGLGLRRVHWRTSTMNIASARLAEKMGFEKIGVVPWHMRFVKGKIRAKTGNGKDLPPGNDPEDLWRDTIDYSLSWERWESFAREETRKQIAL